MERRLVATRAIPFSVMSTSNAVRKNRNDISHENNARFFVPFFKFLIYTKDFPLLRRLWPVKIGLIARPVTSRNLLSKH